MSFVNDSTLLRARRIVRGATVLGLLCFPALALAQVPPRFYWKNLEGTQAVLVLPQSLSGNASPLDPAHVVEPDAAFDAELVIGGYGRQISVFGRSALVAALLPMGRISGDVTVGGLATNAQASGFGDPLLEFDINLIGPKPIKNIPDVLRYEPGFSLDLLVDLAVPIGEYDNDELLNLGQNRWYGRVGAPIVLQLGPWVPGRRTTLEFLPSLWIFGDNDDLAGSELSTDPMFQLEGHFTRDLVEDLWASFDATWVTGGRSSVDGVEGAALNNVGVGFALGYHINDNLQFTGGYMATVNDSEPTDLRMDGFRLSLVFGWHSLIEGTKRLEGD